MQEITPELVLATSYVLDARGCIVTTREPGASRGPSFAVVRTVMRSAFAVHTDLADSLDEIANLMKLDPYSRQPDCEPMYAEFVRSIVARHRQTALQEEAGPVFGFPEELDVPSGVEVIEDEHRLARHFTGWTPGEIANGRAPMMAVIEDGAPVSICFCARRGEEAAQAGVDTALPFRRRGLATRVTLAWARAIRAAGSTPIYTTRWNNTASRAVARKLGLRMRANHWTLT